MQTMAQQDMQEKQVYPLLPSQEGIYYAWMSKPEATCWNLPVSIAYGKEVDMDRLEKALRSVLASRKECHIRLCRDAHDRPQQYIAEDQAIPIIRRTETESRAQDYIANRFVRPFQPFDGPLCRFEMLETPERHYLLLDFHHLIADGMTISHLFLGTDLPRAYQQCPLEAQAYGMLEQALAQERVVATSRYEEDRAYHHARFKDHPFTHLGSQPADPWGRYLRSCLMLGRRAVDAWCERLNTSGSTLFAAAFSLVLSRLSGERDVAYLGLSHGRGDRRLRTAYGMFVQTIPQRIEHGAHDTLADLFTRQHREQFNGHRHGSYPLTHFCDDLHRGTGITFGYQSAMIPEQVPMGGSLYEGRQLPFTECRNELSCTIYVHAQEYEIRLEASEAWYDEEFLRCFAHAMGHVVEQMVRLPLDTPLDCLTLVCEEGRRELDGLSRGDSMSWPKDKTVVDLILENAKARNSERIAICDQYGTMSYAQLAGEVETLSTTLQEKGIGRGDIVALILPRDRRFVVAALGVMHSGAAYLPLDDSHPDMRHRQLIADSQAKFVIRGSEYYRPSTTDELSRLRIERIDSDDGLASDGLGNNELDELDELDEFKASDGLGNNELHELDEFKASEGFRNYELDELDELKASQGFRNYELDELDELKASEGLGNNELHELDELKASQGFRNYELDELDESRACGLADEEVADDALAYIIYTSGTTGSPKGVMISHRALTHFVSVTARLWHLDEHSRISCHASFAFDASVEDLYPVLTVGGTLYLPDETTRHDLHALRQYIEKHHITGGCYSPQFALLLTHDHPLAVDYLCVGGDTMTARPQTHGRVMNTYGPTEMTVNATYCDIPRDHHGDIPIGRPLPNHRAYVLDYAGRLLPRGMVGELCLSGPQMAMGYWHRCEETATHFMYHPLLGRRLYHTGDKVRWNADGLLEYHGRKDHQIEMNGQRIEPYEVERMLLRLDGLRQAVVSKQGAALCVHYTSDRPMDAKAMRQQLRAWLPPYMIPQLWQRMDHLPLTHSDKVDRHHLPPIVQERDSAISPVNETEHLLLGLFREILGTADLGVTDNFFDMGGSSLSVIELVERSRERGIPIDYASVYRWGDVRTLSSHLLPHPPSAVHPLWHVSEGFSPYPIPTVHPSPRDIGDLLLTGGTGYLGRFVLAEYLRSESGTAYCLVRGKEGEARDRLLKALLPLLGEEALARQAQRIVVVTGDIRDAAVFRPLEAMGNSLHTAIHCAADVSHYGIEDHLWRTHVEGTRHLMAFCQRHGIHLTYLSTLSIAGVDEGSRPYHLSENNYFMGQWFTNPYDYTKFMAEHLLIGAMNQGNIRCTIVRPGFLIAPERSESLLPERPDLFVALDLLVEEIGMLPQVMERQSITFSHVDETAHELLGVCRGIGHSPIHHPRCSHQQSLGTLMRLRHGSVRFVEREVFGHAFEPISHDVRFAPLAAVLLCPFSEKAEE